MENRGYRNYLFDLYGTLVDIHTEEDDPQLWQQLGLLLGMEGAFYGPGELQGKYLSLVSALEAEVRKRRGEYGEIDISPVFQSIYTDKGFAAGPREAARLARIFRVLSIKKLRLFPGVLATLRHLRNQGRKVYLLSNAQRLFTAPELELLGLMPYFDGVVLSSDEGIKKPDPVLYHLALDRFGLDAAETVMVGNDDMADCWGAANAGLDSMYIFTEQSPRRTRPLPKNCRVLKDITDVVSSL